MCVLSFKVTPKSFIYLQCKTSVATLLTWLVISVFTWLSCTLTATPLTQLPTKRNTTLHGSAVMFLFSFNWKSVRRNSVHYVSISAATHMGDAAGITSLHGGNNFTSLFPASACTTKSTTAVASVLDQALSCLSLLLCHGYTFHVRPSTTKMYGRTVWTHRVLICLD